MRVIKKYPNRRLYDTEKSRYIKLAEVHDIIREGVEFQVVDADSGEDITRNILIQIIIDQEHGDTPIFTTDMLTRMIRFYDDATHSVFGDFLDQNLKYFSDVQQRFQDQVGDMMDVTTFPKMVQDMAERNLNTWQAMQKQFLDMAMGGGLYGGADEGGEEKEAGNKDGQGKKKS